MTEPVLSVTAPLEMPTRAEQLVERMRAAPLDVSNADSINGLTSAYCGVVRAEAPLSSREGAQRLGNFSRLLFMAVAGEKNLR